MTPIDANLSNKIEQDILGSMENALEKKTKDLLVDLQKKGLLSDQELTDVYNTNFQKIVQGSIDDADTLVDKVDKLKSVQNKLLAGYMAKAKEKNEEPHAVKRVLYWTCGIDNDIAKNSAAKNIIKGVIDELMSIPEMIIEIVKNPLQFGKGLYEALITNFTQTMKAIKESYADAFGGVSTPESAYKTGRSSVLILLTFFPGAIGKTLLNIGRKTARLATNLGKGTRKAAAYSGNAAKSGLEKAFPKSAESLAKSSSKRKIDITKNRHTPEEAAAVRRQRVIAEGKKKLSDLKTGIIESKPVVVVGKGVDIAKKGVAKLGKGVNYMYNLPLVNDILNLPIRLAKWGMRRLGDIIPQRFQPGLIKDIAKIAEINKKLININTRIAKHPNNLDLIPRKTLLETQLVSAKDVLRKDLTYTSIGLGVIATTEVYDIMNQLTSDQVLKQLGVYLQEENSEYVDINFEKSAVGLETGSVDVSADDLDYPALEGFDWNSIDWNAEKKPVITITGLASKTGSLEINDSLSRQRAEKAKNILMEKYGIPEKAFIMHNEIQPQDDESSLSDWQGVRVHIDNLAMKDLTYVAAYDDLLEKYKNAPQSSAPAAIAPSVDNGPSSSVEVFGAKSFASMVALIQKDVIPTFSDQKLGYNVSIVRKINPFISIELDGYGEKKIFSFDLNNYQNAQTGFDVPRFKQKLSDIMVLTKANADKNREHQNTIDTGITSIKGSKYAMNQLFPSLAARDVVAYKSFFDTFDQSLLKIDSHTRFDKNTNQILLTFDQKSRSNDTYVKNIPVPVDQLFEADGSLKSKADQLQVLARVVKNIVEDPQNGYV